MPIARNCATSRGTVTCPWWYWASTKRRSSGPKWPSTPAGKGADHRPPVRRQPALAASLRIYDPASGAVAGRPRTSAAPAASAASFWLASVRSSGAMPQFVHGNSRSGGT